jgi:hypothetical protein
VIIDPHQDVWSRFTGGDGAPWWTLAIAGFDMENWQSLAHTDAATLYSSFPTEKPKMHWPTNYGKLAAATMFTLFFAGDAFAPGIKVIDDGCQEHITFWKNVKTLLHEDDGLKQHSERGYDCGLPISIQEYLRKYYLMFIAAVAHSVSAYNNVIGFNTMNEPSNGFVGLGDLRQKVFGLPLGNLLSAFEGMILASGEALDDVEFYHLPFLKLGPKQTLNRLKHQAWKNESLDVWRRLGVFEKNDETHEVSLLQPHYFSYNGSFIDEFMTPFFYDVQKTVRRFSNSIVTFAEPFINCTHPSYIKPPDNLDPNDFAWSPHWVRWGFSFYLSDSHLRLIYLHETQLV